MPLELATGLPAPDRLDAVVLRYQMFPTAGNSLTEEEWLELVRTTAYYQAQGQWSETSAGITLTDQTGHGVGCAFYGKYEYFPKNGMVTVSQSVRMVKRQMPPRRPKSRKPARKMVSSALPEISSAPTLPSGSSASGLDPVMPLESASASPVSSSTHPLNDPEASLRDSKDPALKSPPEISPTRVSPLNAAVSSDAAKQDSEFQPRPEVYACIWDVHEMDI